MGAESTFNQLPGWAKGVLVVAGTGAGLFIGWKIYDVVQTRIALKGATRQLDEADNTIKELSKKQSATLDKFKLAQYANDLFTAMDGRYSVSKMGTDVSAVYRAFTNVKNDLDVVNLIKTYGIKKLSSGSFIIPDFQGTLSEALTTCLNSAEIQALNNLLARKGIKYRF